MTVSTQSDLELWNAFRRGDLQAYEAIYRRYAPALFSYGKRLTSDYDLVRDVIQDVFVEIWQRRETLTDLQTIKFYLFRVLRNALSRNRKHLMDEEPLEWGALWSPETWLPSVEYTITEEEDRQQQLNRLRQGLSKLPERQREALMLAFFDNLSNEEIGHIMGIHVQSVTNHISRALHFLKDVVVSGILAVLLASY
ncbi:MULTISPECIES: RNA polymerase sigma factor [unclassified Siphonobacter]|uniref:RNA polymerase sigma factor n=1 Tax=unclassified Siphonobacter TaxID=2635712 RepID=UPI002783B0DB|nr:MULTISPECIES: sigma-70 family RNA polymerase sigma factor [unclassified Siphonobacter]MDQ1086516.1 RNA polymerase sigma factor (sigma-70 family) [Siphonobacter sp. SORGH_AS_1065]MDR6196786.1 RNA polymerase sigma factor (sigma-70 family) [Siphonobacter sp. SORGH_AS_0500]